ncbi:MAG: dihydropteroate synthase [Planctomycetota bacterium]|nr:dihydropteroate synthase [Planctomycetota bacterium]
MSRSFPESHSASSWRISPNRILQWSASDAATSISSANALIMAIINVTPDSFSDGGEHNDLQRACAFAQACIDDGASILDIGGESTRPGANSVSVVQQIARTQPVVAHIAKAHRDIAISIDTTRAIVAESALDAGATIINDVSAGQDDPDMFALVARRKCGYVLMHRLCEPSKDSYSDQYSKAPHYCDVVANVCTWLVERADAAQAAGIARDSIAIDPGLGFGKTVEQNFALLARMQEVVALGYPVVVSASRKSFLGSVTGEAKPSARVASSIAAALEMTKAGVAVVRAHDIRAHADAFRIQLEIDRQFQRNLPNKMPRATASER